MRMDGLILALMVGLAASQALAQADAIPKKIVAEVSSSAPSSAERAKTVKPKAVPYAAEKLKAAPTTSEPKAAAPPLGSAPEPPESPTKTQPERLPFKLHDQSEAAPEPPSLGGLLWRTFGALLLLVGLIAVAGWGLRYLGIVNFGKPQSETAGLKVLDTVPLGERRTLTIVKFGERTLLIGSTPQGLTLLAEQAGEDEPPGNYMPTVRTVTDLLDVGPKTPFDDELARASLIDGAWQRRVQ